MSSAASGSTGKDSQSIAFSIGELDAAERMQLFQIVCRRHEGNPLIAEIATLPYEQVRQLFGIIGFSFEVTLDAVGAGLRKLNVAVDRQRLYRRLLRAGAPKAMLYRHFAKSRRQIERDRARIGVRAAFTGRPRRIGREQAYEIHGHWERQLAEEGDFARRLWMLHEAFPDIGLASLHRLVQDF